MKLKILSVAVLISVSVLGVQGMTGQKGSFKVAGKCGMCETRIENAALSVRGVESADWDKESGIIELEYDAKKADLDKIQKTIATAGHDTELYTANDKVYEKLPECCKYERVETKSSGCCPASSSKATCGSSKEGCGSSKESSGCGK
jgi:mercuric ion binding protein